ncbi:MAG TPA: AAA domain-containing protein [Polyangiales bacterium]|nr:AAA domain-containing protein [Polyangiales bacterium]
MSHGDPVQDALAKLAELWRREREAAREAHRAQREQLDFGERVRRGLALSGLTLEDTDAAPGGRALLWAKLERDGSLEDARIGVGDPVLLWAGSPEDERSEQGVVARVGWQRLAIAVTAEYGEFLEQGAFNLDREAPEATFERGAQAIARWQRAARGSRLERLRAVYFGDALPELVTPAPVPASFFDPALDATQREAVTLALAARDVALVHGPPGTGKTRTLVEVVRQSLARGERVLVSAASNAAVDNLGERLAQVGVSVIRVGHPARVSAALEARTLDALVDASEARQRARRWIADANELRTRVNRRRARGKLDWQEGRQMLSEARSLMRDARQTLDAERALQLARAQVICATAAGVDTAVLAETQFDLVVLDEATQAVDPIALAALARANRAVLAGDPKQLPPTVIDPQVAAAGLGTTLFERLAARHAGVLAMLLVQYRMHAALMRFPSESMYAGKLLAAPQVAQRSLDDRPDVLADPLRPGPWHFVDCAGKGFTEVIDEDDPSTSNPALAERTAREVLRVLSRGVAPQDVAVITPYLAQVRRLRELLREPCTNGLEVGTVDGFQGREKEVVLVDLVRSNDDGAIGFLADTRRMNVAITRARSLLLVLGDSATLQPHGYYRTFMDSAEQQSAHLSAWSDEADPILTQT